MRGQKVPIDIDCYGYGYGYVVDLSLSVIEMNPENHFLSQQHHAVVGSNNQGSTPFDASRPKVSLDQVPTLLLKKSESRIVSHINNEKSRKLMLFGVFFLADHY
jgi:hypothetical protein